MAILKNKTEEVKDDSNSKETKSAFPAVATGNILLAPRLSEKAANSQKNRTYVFLVDPKSNKIEIKQAVEKFYGVKVESVNTLRLQAKTRTFGGRKGKTSALKKAVVTLTEGSKQPDVLNI